MNIKAATKRCFVWLKYLDKFQKAKYDFSLEEILEYTETRIENEIVKSYEKGVADTEKKFRKTLKTLVDSVKLKK